MRLLNASVTLQHLPRRIRAHIPLHMFTTTFGMHQWCLVMCNMCSFCRGMCLCICHNRYCYACWCRCPHFEHCAQRNMPVSFFNKTKTPKYNTFEWLRQLYGAHPFAWQLTATQRMGFTLVDTLFLILFHVEMSCACEIGVSTSSVNYLIPCISGRPKWAIRGAFDILIQSNVVNFIAAVDGIDLFHRLKMLKFNPLLNVVGWKRTNKHTTPIQNTFSGWNRRANERVSNSSKTLSDFEATIGTHTLSIQSPQTNKKKLRIWAFFTDNAKQNKWK